MEKVIRVSAKLVGAAVLVILLLALCMAAAWAILDVVSPRYQLLFLLAMSALSGLLVAGLTIYRLITTLRSATLILILTSPALVSLMAGLIIYWEIIAPLVKDQAPWMKDILEIIDGFMDWLDHYLGGR